LNVVTICKTEKTLIATQAAACNHACVRSTQYRSQIRTRFPCECATKTIPEMQTTDLQKRAELWPSRWASGSVDLCFHKRDKGLQRSETGREDVIGYFFRNPRYWQKGNRCTSHLHRSSRSSALKWTLSTRKAAWRYWTSKGDPGTGGNVYTIGTKEVIQFPYHRVGLLAICKTDRAAARAERPVRDKHTKSLCPWTDEDSAHGRSMKQTIQSSKSCTGQISWSVGPPIAASCPEQALRSPPCHDSHWKSLKANLCQWRRSWIILEKRLFAEDLLLGRRWTRDGGRKEGRNGRGAYRQDQYLLLCCLVKAHHAFHASRRTVWTPGLLNQWIHFLNFQGLQRKRAPLWLAHSIPSSMPAHLSLSASVCLPLCLSLPHYLTL
jgi:hypothetical protein